MFLTICSWETAAYFVITKSLTLEGLKEVEVGDKLWHSKAVGLHAWHEVVEVVEKYTKSSGTFIEIINKERNSIHTVNIDVYFTDKSEFIQI